MNRREFGKLIAALPFAGLFGFKKAEAGAAFNKVARASLPEKPRPILECSDNQDFSIYKTVPITHYYEEVKGSKLSIILTKPTERKYLRWFVTDEMLKTYPNIRWVCLTIDS